MGDNLSERVKAANQPATTEPGTELERPTLAGSIRNMEAQFKLAMPRGMEATQLVRDALTALRTTRNLAKCDQASVLGGLMTCAQLGLRPAVLGHAWLLPFWDKNAVTIDEAGRQRKGGYRAQLVIGYQGYRELAHRTGTIASLIGRPVHENDTFDVDYGIADTLVHKPFLTGDRGPAVGYYAIVKYANGGHAFWYMSRTEVEQHRDRYAMAKKDGQVVGPWRDNFDEMAVKTVFLRLAKWMPKSTELASAIEADETIRVDTTPDNMDAMLHGERPEPEIDYAPPVSTQPFPGTQRSGDGGPPDIDGEIVENDTSASTSTSAPEPAEPEPLVDSKQLTRIHTLLTKLGVEQTEKHATLSTLAGRTIASSKELTRYEGEWVIEELARVMRQKPEDRSPALDSLLGELRDAQES